MDVFKLDVSNVREAGVAGIVRPAPKEEQRPATPQQLVRDHIPIPIIRPQQWAPAWFYSALNWLGKSYYDANNTLQQFNTYMAGSDVDPYASIGSTRLFLIFRIRGSYFRLSIAADVDSIAPATDGTVYPDTDEGIRDMYLALAASPVFASIKYCYIPGRIGPDLDRANAESFAAVGTPLENGYDPNTGLRAIVLGSAVSQVVPVDQFIKVHNEQIYNPSPARFLSDFGDMPLGTFCALRGYTSHSHGLMRDRPPACVKVA